MSFNRVVAGTGTASITLGPSYDDADQQTTKISMSSNVATGPALIYSLPYNLLSLQGGIGTAMHISTSGTGNIFLEAAANATIESGETTTVAGADVVLAATTSALIDAGTGNARLKVGAGKSVEVGNDSNPVNYKLSAAAPTAAGQCLVSSAGGAGSDIGWQFPEYVANTSVTGYNGNLTVLANALVGGILLNTASGVTSWTLDTAANITAAFGDSLSGTTHVVWVCNTGGGQILFPPVSGLTIFQGTPSTGGFTMLFRYAGSNTYSVYIG